MMQGGTGGPERFPAAVIFNLSAKAALLGLLLFTFRGSLAWAAGWIYLGLYAAWSFANTAWLQRRNPGLVAKRLGAPTPEFAADRVFALAMPALFAVLLAVCARFPGEFYEAGDMFARACAFDGLVVAYWLVSYALGSNKFAVKAVALQPGQAVEKGGPYAYVRHPLYAAFIFFCLCTPPALGSYYGYFPAAALALVTAARAYFEDEFLREKLAGYKEYAQQVKYRLVPGIW